MERLKERSKGCKVEGSKERTGEMEVSVEIRDARFCVYWCVCNGRNELVLSFLILLCK